MMMEEIIQAIKQTKTEIGNKEVECEWREYRLYDIFDISYGNKFDKVDMTYKSPIINFIGRSGENNGIVGVVDLIDNVKPYQSGCLTLALGGSIGSCFVQQKDFYTGQNIAVLKSKNDISNEIKKVLAKIIQKTAQSGKYETFNNELNKHIKTDFVFTLPSKNKQPDFEMMEEIILNLKKQTELNRLLELKMKNNITKLDTSKWEEVILTNEGAGKEIILKLKEGNINLVSSTENNNGVVKKVSGYKKLFDGNKLTLAKNGSVGNVFYQAEPFCATSDVVVLSHPKLTKNSALFIKTILEKQTKQFDYNNKINSKNLDKITLKLPSFEFMEKFMDEIKL